MAKTMIRGRGRGRGTDAERQAEEERIRPTASVRKERTRGMPRGRGRRGRGRGDAVEALPETLGLYDEMEHVLESAGIPRGTRGWKIVDRLKAIAKPFKRGLRSFSCASHATDVSQPRPQ